jgi:hypothetical protein
MVWNARRHRLRLSVSSVCLLALYGCGGSSGGSAKSSTSRPATPQAVSSAPASAGTGNSVTAGIGGVTATMHAGTHRPKANTTWPFRFAVVRAGKPVTASVSYEYLLGGQVVGRASRYTFSGHFSDTTSWPAASIGYPLTFRAVVRADGATINLDYPVQVTR